MAQNIKRKSTSIDDIIINNSSSEPKAVRLTLTGYCVIISIALQALAAVFYYVEKQTKGDTTEKQKETLVHTLVNEAAADSSKNSYIMKDGDYNITILHIMGDGVTSSTGEDVLMWNGTMAKVYSN